MQEKNLNPAEVYVANYYTIADKKANLAFYFTFPKYEKSNTDKFIIKSWDESPAIRRLKSEYCTNITTTITPDVLAVELLTILEDKNEKTTDRIKAIETFAKLKKMFAEEVNLNHKHEIILTIPEFEGSKNVEIDMLKNSDDRDELIEDAEFEVIIETEDE